MVWGFVESHRLRADIEQIRGAGEPLTFDELANMSKATTGTRDAAVFYRDALELSIPDEFYDIRQSVRQRYAAAREEGIAIAPGDPVRKRASQLLDDLKELFELVGQAAAIQTCRFELGAETVSDTD